MNHCSIHTTACTVKLLTKKQVIPENEHKIIILESLLVYFLVKSFYYHILTFDIMSVRSLTSTCFFFKIQLLFLPTVANYNVLKTLSINLSKSNT